MAKKKNIDVNISQLLNGDCLKVMKTIPDDSIDCIITDPPYNLGLFMHNRNTNFGKNARQSICLCRLGQYGV